MKNLNFLEFQKKANEAKELPLQFSELVYSSLLELPEPRGQHGRNIHSSYSPSKKKRTGKQLLITFLEIGNKNLVQAFTRPIVSQSGIRNRGGNSELSKSHN